MSKLNDNDAKYFSKPGQMYKHKGHVFVANTPWTAGTDEVIGLQTWRAKTCSVPVLRFQYKTGKGRWNVKQGYFNDGRAAFEFAVKAHDAAMGKARKLLSNYGDIFEQTGIELRNKHAKGLPLFDKKEEAQEEVTVN